MRPGGRHERRRQDHAAVEPSAGAVSQSSIRAIPRRAAPVRVRGGGGPDPALDTRSTSTSIRWCRAPSTTQSGAYPNSSRDTSCASTAGQVHPRAAARKCSAYPNRDSIRAVSTSTPTGWSGRRSRQAVISPVSIAAGARARSAARSDGSECREGWTLYQTTGPRLKGTDIPADFHYFNWVDRDNILGPRREHAAWRPGSNSDSLLVLDPATRQWLTLRVPYPLGFYSRGMDGRIDAPERGLERARPLRELRHPLRVAHRGRQGHEGQAGEVPAAPRSPRPLTAGQARGRRLTSGILNQVVRRVRLQPDLATGPHVRSPSAPQFPTPLARPVDLVLGIDDAAGCDPLARFAARAPASTRTRARHRRPGSRRTDRRVLAVERRGRRRARPSPPDDGDAGVRGARGCRAGGAGVLRA